MNEYKIYLYLKDKEFSTQMLNAMVFIDVEY